MMLCLIATLFIMSTVANAQTQEQIQACLSIWEAEGARITNDVSIVGTPYEARPEFNLPLIPGDKLKFVFKDETYVFRPKAEDSHNIDDLLAVFNALERPHPVFGMILPDGTVRMHEVPSLEYLHADQSRRFPSLMVDVPLTDMMELQCIWAWSWHPQEPTS